MQTYDVYLKKRLTEIDAIITQLVQRDSFVMYDWLSIFCTMNDLEVRKNLQINSMVNLDAHVNDLLEIVYEQIINEMILQADMILLNKVIANGETEMVLCANELDILEKSFISGNSVLDILVAPLEYSIAHSFGRVEFNIEILTEALDTLKYSIDKFAEELLLTTNIDFSSLKTAELDELRMLLDVEPTNIFYLLTTGGKSTTYFYVNPISEHILKKVIYGVESEMYLSANTDINWQLQKNIEIANSLNLFADMADVLIQFISGQFEMFMDCEARAGLKRYRLLSEMDNHTLSDFDNMTLEEIDYVILAE